MISGYQLTNKGGLEFLATIFYLSNSREEIKIVWKALKDISISANGLFWIVIGVFDEIRAPEDRRDQDVYCHGSPSEFIRATDLACLIELTPWTVSSIYQ